MTKFKKLLALALTDVMTFALLPTTVIAADTEFKQDRESADTLR